LKKDSLLHLRKTGWNLNETSPLHSNNIYLLLGPMESLYKLIGVSSFW
jgi:hypothetical protein